MTARNAFFSSPVVGHDRKVVLMMNQRRRQHFLGSSRNSRAKVPATTAGILDQVGHFLEQRRVLAVDGGTRPPSRRALRLELARDPVAPLGVLEDDEVLGQPRAVLVERPRP